MMLVPAAVLVLIILGAIAIDSAVVMLAQRDLNDETAAVANDIAAFAAADGVFYRDGIVTLSGDRATEYTALAFAADRRPAGTTSWHGTAELVDARTVRVRATASVRYVFAKALPGFPDETTVTAISTAEARS